jgi:hypothetical protein
MALQHIVDCSAGPSDHYAVDVEITGDELATFLPPEELLKPVIEARRARRADALARLHIAALTDPVLADLLTVLGAEED